MHKNIILALVLFFTFTQVTSAQIFDQTRLDERVANLKKYKRISKRALKAMVPIQELVKSGNYDTALKGALEINTKRFNTTDFVTYYQLTATIYQNMGDPIKFRELTEKILELPGIQVSMYKLMLLNVGMLYYAEGNYDKALEFYDLHLTYEQSPHLSTYMVAVVANIAKKDYENALRYVDLGDQAYIQQVQNYNKWELKRYNDKTDKRNKQLVDARELLRGLISREDTESIVDNPDLENTPEDQEKTQN